MQLLNPRRQWQDWRIYLAKCRLSTECRKLAEKVRADQPWKAADLDQRANFLDLTMASLALTPARAKGTAAYAQAKRLYEEVAGKPYLY